MKNAFITTDVDGTTGHSQALQTCRNESHIDPIGHTDGTHLTVVPLVNDTLVRNTIQF